MLGSVPVKEKSTANNQTTTAMKFHQLLIAASLPFAFASCGEKVEKKTEEVKAAAADTMDKAKDAATAEVDKVKDAAAAEVDKAKDAAADAIDAGADAAKEAADKLKSE